MKVLFIILLASLSARQVYCETLEVEVSIIDRLTTENGAYIKILNHAFSQMEHEIVFRFYPPNRAHQVYKNKKSTCNLPSAIELEDAKNAHFSVPLFLANLFVYTRKDSPIINHINELDGKRVVYHGGWPLGKAQNNKFSKKIVVNTTRQVYDVLMATKPVRVDAALIYHPDINLVTSKKERSFIHKNSNLVVTRVLDRLICHQTEKNKIILKDLNRVLKKMKLEHKIDKILKEHGII